MLCPEDVPVVLPAVGERPLISFYSHLLVEVAELNMNTVILLNLTIAHLRVLTTMGRQ